MLTLAADIYTAVGEYEKAIDILQQAYEYATMGRRIVYRLTELALKAIAMMMQKIISRSFAV